MVDMLVLAFVACLGLGSLVCCVMGLIAMTSKTLVEDYFTNLMCGLAMTLFSAAILTCCFYTSLPFGNGEGYAVPLAFCGFGMAFLAVSGKQYHDHRKAVSADLS